MVEQKLKKNEKKIQKIFRFKKKLLYLHCKNKPYV